ncbi:HipA family kinase, partial [Acetobacter estunensis]
EEIESYRRPQNQGVFRTLHVAGRAAILKDLDATQLFNELLSFLVAREIGLPVPDGFLAIVEKGSIKTKYAPLTPDGFPVVFASADVKQPNLYSFITMGNGRIEDTLLKFMINSLKKWEFLGALYGFDTWTANIDRHCGNLLFDGEKNFWLIDHGHSFSGPDWPCHTLSANGCYENRLSEWMTPHLCDTDRNKQVADSDNFFGPISCDVFCHAVDKISSFGLLPENCVASLREFLKDRKRYVNHYVEALREPLC